MTRNRDASDAGRFATAIMVTFAFVVAMFYIAWRFYHAQISFAVIRLRVAEFRGLQALSAHADPYTAALLRMHPDAVSAHGLWMMLTRTGLFFRSEASLLLIGCTFVCALRAAMVRYGGQVDIKELQRLVARVHPIGTAWVGYHLPPKNLDPREPIRPLDPPLKPREWVARFCMRDGSFSPDDATVALRKQCGAPWAGLEAASPVVQCLAMAFVLHHRLKTAEARKLLETLSKSVPHSRAHRQHGPAKAFSPPRAFARKMKAMAKDSLTRWPEIHALEARHAYTSGLLLTLLQTARREGSLLNPGLFASVQFYDRSLWMVLQGIAFPPDKGPIWGGAATSDVEALGALEHWETECIAGGALAAHAQSGTMMAVQKVFDAQAQEASDAHA